MTMAWPNRKEFDLDTMLMHSGDFGKFQYIQIALFCLNNVLSAFHYFGQSFISVEPEGYRCKLVDDELNQDVITFPCTKTYFNHTTSFSLPCVSGWDYKRYYGYTSIVEELGWICQNDWKPALGQSMFFVGSGFGTYIFGVLSDRFGRLKVLIASNLMAFFGNLLSTQSSNVTVFAISRFVAGCATDANFVMMYILVMEYLRPSKRTSGLNLCIGVFYCIGCAAVPWVAVLFKVWDNFLLLISILSLLIIMYPFYIVESACWLVSNNKIERALECFQHIAKVNKKTIRPDVVQAFKNYCLKHISTIRKNESILSLLRTPKLRRKTLILVFKSMVITLCYDTISRNINGLGLSPFITFSVTSSTIFPACVFIVAFQDKVGRKALASGALLLSGVFTAVSALILSMITAPNTTLILSIAVFTRLCINVAYNSSAQYAVELIPAEVRGRGVCVIHVMGYIASFFSSYILYAAHIWKPCPEIILGILQIIGAVACLYLPETLNKALPVTLKDGEEFGEGEGIFDFAFWHHSGYGSTTVLNPASQTTLYHERY